MISRSAADLKSGQSDFLRPCVPPAGARRSRPRRPPPDGRQAEDLPLVGRAVGHLPQQPAGQVVAVPAGVREHDPGLGREPRVQVVGVPVPDPLPHDRAVGVLALAEGVVDDRAVGRVAGDRVAHPRRAQAAAVAGDLEEVHRAAGFALPGRRCGPSVSLSLVSRKDLLVGARWS